MSRAIRLALEDAQAGDDIGTAEGTDLAVAEATVEAQSGAAEVTEATTGDDGVATYDTAIDEASADAGVVEGTYETVASSLDPEGPTGGDGMDPLAATLATETIERIRTKYVIGSRTVRSMPAIESYKPRQSRKEVARLALEGIGDTLKKVWERIKSFFRSLWDRIKTAIKSVFQSNIKSEKRALELKKKLREGTFNSPKETSIKSGTICSAFNDDGKSDAKIVLEVLLRHTKLLDCVNDVNKVSYDLSKEVGSMIGSLGSAMKSGTAAGDESYIKSVKAQAERLSKAFTGKLGSADKETGKDAKKFNDLFNGDKVDRDASKVEFFGPFYGSKFLYVLELVKQKDNGANASNFQEVTVSADFRKLGRDAATSINTASSAEMNSILDGVVKMCQAVAFVERAMKLGDSAANEILSSIDSAITATSKLVSDREAGQEVGMGTKTTGATQNFSSQMNYVRASVVATIKILTTSNGPVIGNTMSAINTSMDYVQASMNAYKD